MSKSIDLTGQKFGRLIVLERYGSNRKNVALWKCQCDCGNIKIARSDMLRCGNTKSCGCLMLDRARETSIKNKNKRYNENYYEEHGDVTYLFDKSRQHYAIIDTSIIPFVKDFYWKKGNNGYWITQVKNSKNIKLLHVFVHSHYHGNNKDALKDIDHKDRNVDNNTCDNLRLVTRRENIANRIRNPITFNKKWQKYIAQITYCEVHYYLGGYVNKADADALYKYAHKLFYKECSPYFNENIDVSHIKMTKTTKEALERIDNITTIK